MTMDLLSHSQHNILQAEYFGERAEIWHNLGLALEDAK
jgi:hypothetical protein